MNSLPDSPGCYIFKDHKKILYIGKAKNIKKRVNSYFTGNLDPKTSALVKKIKKIDFIATDNETEALILENNLIKKYGPKYNVDLKDAKSYAYIQLTNEKFPRLVLARQKGKGKYFGPFVSGRERDYILTTLQKTFKLRTCRKLPKRACLRYHIGLCNAPCIGNISKEDYNNDVKDAVSVLRGKSRELVGKLSKKMKRFSERKDYENALKMRDTILAVKHLKEQQTMQREKAYDEDVVNYIVKDEKVYLLIFNVHHGTLINKKEFSFDYIEGFFEDFLMQYYSLKAPKEIMVPSIVDEHLGEVLKTKFIVPKIGEKKKLMEIAQKNIELSFFADEKKMEYLRVSLKLEETPKVIECFDISHLSGISTVGSMVQFRNGKKDKSNYRRFKIKSVSGVDDFKAIGEIVRRRYKRLKKEKVSMPNLIVIDGGKGQLKAALNELNKLRVKIPVISIAKKFEEIYVPGLSFPLKVGANARLFIQEIRDEAHRFAISYNRLLRKKDIK